MMDKQRKHWIKPGSFIILSLVLAGLFLLNLISGSVYIPINEVFSILFGDSGTFKAANEIIVGDFRLNQAITAMLSGAGLAVAGLLMQTLFRNPLADPSILGISSGASLGVAVMLMVLGSVSGNVAVISGVWGSVGLIVAASVGAFLVLLLILAVSNRIGNIVSLLIIGIMISYIGGALVGLIKYYGQKDDVHAFVIWGMGSFSNVSNSILPFFGFSLIIPLLLSFLFVKPLNLLLLGEKYASGLGLKVKTNQWLVLLIAGFLTAVVTAFAGPVAFIGLAVPHFARNLFKTSGHSILLPAVVLIGAILALFCNWIARLPGFDGNLPINAVTSLIGAPMVIWIIIRRKDIYRSNS